MRVVHGLHGFARIVEGEGVVHGLHGLHGLWREKVLSTD